MRLCDKSQLPCRADLKLKLRLRSQKLGFKLVAGTYISAAHRAVIRTALWDIDYFVESLVDSGNLIDS